jgi:hypothetical protein
MAFMFRLEQEDGSPADPPTLKSAVPDWRPGDTIPLGRRSLRVVAVRDDDADQPPALVVEDLSEPGASEQMRSCDPRTGSERGPVRAGPRTNLDLLLT